MRFLPPLVDLLFPLTCASCRMPGSWLCRVCRPPCAPAIIERAGLRVLLAQDPPDPRAVAALFSLKYEGFPDAAQPLASLLAAVIAHACGTSSGLVLVPVPTTIARRRARGFDQAEVLAERTGALLGLPVLPLLARTRDTARQVGLGRSERMANLEHAFVATAPPAGTRVLLVDDVCTTGATFQAAAEALRDAGATRIGAVALFGRTC